MSVLTQLLEQGNPYDAYTRRVRENDQASMQSVQQAGGLMGIVNQMQAQAQKQQALQREAQMRDVISRLPADATPEQVAAAVRPFAGADDLLKTASTSADRKVTVEATRENARARNAAALQMANNTHQARLATLTRQQDRDAEIARHNQMVEAIQRDALANSGARLAYDTGTAPAATSTALAAAQAAPSAPQEVTYSFNTPEGRIAGTAPSANAALGTIGLREVPPMSVAPAPRSLADPSADAWTPTPPPIVTAPPSNMDARDRRLVPGTPPPAPTARPQMPNFTGSPREVARARNDWLMDMAKAAQKEASKDGKISVNLAGGRESVFINRVVNSGNQAAADLENVVKLPISASRGLLGGRSQGKSLFEAGKETLANTMTTQEVQTYNVFATGFQRALAAIEGAGLAPTNALMHQMDAVIFKEGDTNFTKLAKLAQTRQIVEKGLETISANSRVDAETKKLVDSIITKVRTAVPFTGSELIELQRLQAVDPNATLKDVMAQAKQQQGGWSIRPR